MSATRSTSDSITPMTTGADGMGDEPMRTDVVTTSVGRVRYTVTGQGDPVVLLHGNGHSAHEWHAVMRALEGDARVYAWDMPGQGDSDPLPRHLSIEDYAGVLEEMLEELDLDGATVVGSSVGGCICASLGARASARVRALVFVETNFRTPAWWRDNWGMIEDLFAVPTQTFDDVASRYRDLDADHHDRHNKDRNKAGGRAMMSVMWAIREFDIEQAARSTTLPSVLLFGANGPTIGGREPFLAAMPHASSVTLDESGHFPMTDQPLETAAVVLDAVTSPRA